MQLITTDDYYAQKALEREQQEALRYYPMPGESRGRSASSEEAGMRPAVACVTPMAHAQPLSYPCAQPADPHGGMHPTQYSQPACASTMGAAPQSGYSYYPGTESGCGQHPGGAPQYAALPPGAVVYPAESQCYVEQGGGQGAPQQFMQPTPVQYGHGPSGAPPPPQFASGPQPGAMMASSPSQQMVACGRQGQPPQETAPQMMSASGQTHHAAPMQQHMNMHPQPMQQQQQQQQQQLSSHGCSQAAASSSMGMAPQQMMTPHHMAVHSYQGPPPGAPHNY